LIIIKDIQIIIRIYYLGKLKVI